MAQQIKLEENEILLTYPQVKECHCQLLNAYKAMITDKDMALGQTNMFKVEIKLSAMETCLRVQINSWLRDDIITHTESPWAGPLVPMAKMDGSTKWGGT